MKYITATLVEAEKMDLTSYMGSLGKDISGYDRIDPGYKVTDAYGNVTWKTAAQFEGAHILVGDNNTITQSSVDEFIADYEVISTDKTTIVKATLVNGFVIVESSSCVDPANYDPEVGAKICLDRIKNKIWELLGFLLQSSVTMHNIKGYEGAQP